MKLKERTTKKISNAHFSVQKSKKGAKRCKIDLNTLEMYMEYMSQDDFK